MIREAGLEDIVKVYLQYNSYRFPNLAIDNDILVNSITNNKGYIAYGYYSPDGEILGFIDGYEINSEVFCINIVYAINHARSALLLEKRLESHALDKGYKVLGSLSTEDTKSIVTKLGFKEI